MFAHLGPDAIDALHEEHRFQLLRHHPRRRCGHEHVERLDHDPAL